jgi:DNA repair protein SbcC/Rad50
MKPLKLTLRAFGPFLDPTVIDFERLDRYGPFLIQGTTGSGKSTLFEAMTFALFGDAGKDRERDSQNLVSTLLPDRVAASMDERSMVEFTFTAQGKRYVVTRYPTQHVARSRSRAGSSEPVRHQAAATLRIDDGGATEVIEDVRNVNEAIVAAIGCDVAQFRQTILLPQGEFRRVVTDPKERQTTLKRIFRTDRYEQLTNALKEAWSDAQDRHDRVHDQVGSWLTFFGATGIEEVAGRRAAIEAEAERAAARRRDADALRSQRLTALQGAEALGARFAERDTLRGRQARFVSERGLQSDRERRLAAAERAQGLLVALSQRSEAERRREGAEHEVALRGQRSEAAQERYVAAAAALAAEGDRGAERQALQVEVTRLTALEPRVADLARTQAAAAHDAAAHEAALREGEALAARIVALQASEATLEAERALQAPLALGLDDARTHEAALRALHDDLRRAADLEHEAEGFALDVRALEGTLADEVGHGTLQDALRHYAPGIVASTLRSGEPCPACGGRDHPAPHRDVDPTALEGALARIQARAEERSRLLDRIARLHSEAAALRDGHAARLAVTPDPAAALAAASAAAQTAKRATERVGAIDAESARLQRELGEVRDAQRLGSERAAELRIAMATRSERLASLAAELPADARDPQGFEAHATALRARATELQRAWDAAVAGERSAATDRDAAAELLAAARKQAAEATAERDLQVAAFATALADAGFGDEAAFASARLEAAAVAALRGEIERHRRDRDEVERRLGELEAALAGGSPPDLTALQAALEEAETAWQGADAAYVTQAQRRDTARQGGEAIDRLAPELQRLGERRGAAERLYKAAAGKVGGSAKVSLENYALEILFEAVLGQANHHLEQMTRHWGGNGTGPYTLHLPERRDQGDRALDLEVIDHGSNGVRRPARTLSGGEGFMAALALALGLAEATARERYPIEALFIDEGFGTLDRVSLAKVVAALRNLPQFAHRMVGVISHVEELKRLIPVHLLVERGATGGSRLRIDVNAG